MTSATGNHLPHGPLDFKLISKFVLAHQDPLAQGHSNRQETYKTFKPDIIPGSNSFLSYAESQL